MSAFRPYNSDSEPMTYSEAYVQELYNKIENLEVQYGHALSDILDLQNEKRALEDQLSETRLELQDLQNGDCL